MSGAAVQHIKNTCYEIKRLIGVEIDDPNIKDDLEKKWAFKVDADASDKKPYIELEVDNLTKWPEEISALVLEYLKKAAESKLRCPIKKAVVTCPAYFNDR